MVTDKQNTALFSAEYRDIKRKFPDAIVLCREGDFYEVFGEDAKAVSQILGLNLASRVYSNRRVDLAGFPHHALDTYLSKLVRAGRRVAICGE